MQQQNGRSALRTRFSVKDREPVYLCTTIEGRMSYRFLHLQGCRVIGGSPTRIVASIPSIYEAASLAAALAICFNRASRVLAARPEE